MLKTDDKGRAHLLDRYKVSGDESYYDKSGSACSPLGTLLIQETKAPDGYALEGQDTNSLDYKAPYHAMIIRPSGNDTKIEKIGGNKFNHSSTIEDEELVRIHFDWANGTKNLKDGLDKWTWYQIGGVESRLELPHTVYAVPGATKTLPTMSSAHKYLKDHSLFFKPYGWYKDPNRITYVDTNHDVETQQEIYISKNSPKDITLYVYYDVRYPDGIVYYPTRPL